MKLVETSAEHIPMRRPRLAFDRHPGFGEYSLTPDVLGTLQTRCHERPLAPSASGFRQGGREGKVTVIAARIDRRRSDDAMRALGYEVVPSIEIDPRRQERTCALRQIKCRRQNLADAPGILTPRGSDIELARRHIDRRRRPDELHPASRVGRDAPRP
jgi:hypothetical protein